MEIRDRFYGPILKAKIEKPFVHLIFGARQTGKSTLVKSILPSEAQIIDLSDPRERMRFATDPGLFIDVCRSLPSEQGPSWVFVDEAQTVPSIFDAVQSLYDKNKERFRFILCGSSARRLRAQSANLLPGRSVRHLLHPLLTSEYAMESIINATPRSAWPSFPWRTEEASGALCESVFNPGPSPSDGASHVAKFPFRTLENRLVFGDLPGIALQHDDADKADLLYTYVASYLEEEIRREATIRQWDAFVRFLKFAAVDSGAIVNFSSLSREAGVSLPTIKSYYQILEDMFVGLTVPAFSGSPHKSALTTPRFFFFDNGVRNAAADIPLVESSVNIDPGHFFEHWIAGQLWRALSYTRSGTLLYYRTSDGAEVDFIVQTNRELIPIEVKWTDHPRQNDTRHLKTFIAEQSTRCTHGYLVSRCPYVLDLGNHISAIPWWML